MANVLNTDATLLQEFCDGFSKHDAVRGRSGDGGADILKQRSPDMRRAAYALGAREAKLAAAALGACASRVQAAAWINGAIDERSEELRRAGASDKDIEVWDWACRIMFMLKIRHAIVD